MTRAVILSTHATPLVDVIHSTTSIIQKHGTIAIPTESFYALAASALDPIAVGRVTAMKENPQGKPILVLISDRSQLKSLTESIPPAAQVLMDRFWPGPLTLVFPARAGLPEGLTSGTDSIGVRQIHMPIVFPLLQQIGPVTGTSANRIGEVPPCTAQEVYNSFANAIDLILDAGSTPGGQPSTLVDTREPVRLLREGPISSHQLQEVLRSEGYSFHW